MREINVTFVDLETTGLDAHRHELIEAAAIKTRVNKDNEIEVIDHYNCKVKPKRPVHPAIARLNGYNEWAWSQDGQKLELAVGKVFDLMEGSWHAGSNPRFDAGFLANAARKLHWNYPKLASHHLIDVTTLSFDLYLHEKINKLNQDNLATYYELGGCKHRAFDDALQCLKIFAKTQNLKIVGL